MNAEPFDMVSADGGQHALAHGIQIPIQKLSEKSRTVKVAVS